MRYGKRAVAILLLAAVVGAAGIVLYEPAPEPTEQERMAAAVNAFREARNRMTPEEVRDSFGEPDEVFRDNPRALCWAYNSPYKIRMCWGPKRQAAWIGSNVPLPGRAPLDFVTVQERFAQGEVRPLGPISTLARGRDWAFMAWRSEKGICIAYAVGEVRNFGGSCGAPDRSKSPTARRHLTALRVPSELRGGRIARGAVAGAVTPKVRRVDVELTTGRVLRALILESKHLAADARFFLLRDAEDAAASTRVSALRFYDGHGGLLERFEIAVP